MLKVQRRITPDMSNEGQFCFKFQLIRTELNMIPDKIMEVEGSKISWISSTMTHKLTSMKASVAKV